MTPDEAMKHLQGRTILGIAMEDDLFVLVLDKGQIEISGEDYEVYVETVERQLN
jgi:hypothetical protein